VRPTKRCALDDLHEPFETLHLDRVRHDCLGQLRGLGAAAWREDERERAVITHLLGNLQRLLEVLLRLPRKAHDHVCGERHVRHVLANQCHPVEVALAIVGATHRLEDAAGARL
jgi:hypothetical protein